MADGMNESMIDAGELVAKAGANHLVSELNAFDEHFLGATTPINVNAAVIASDTNTLLFIPFLTVNLFLYLYILNEINLILCLTI